MPPYRFIHFDKRGESLGAVFDQLAIDNVARDDFHKQGRQAELFEAAQVNAAEVRG